jgi:hypothetical protein
MTSARRQRKFPFGRQLLAVPVLLAVLCLGAWNGAASTTERVVVDRLTGLALSGFDPVAYFTDAQPLLGREDVELGYGGAVWRFRNAGNRAAFAADPQVYLPRFGGYDPISIARGVNVPGHPQIWLISGQRLYLFSTRKARDAFMAQPDAAIAIAERKWPEVVRGLAL